MAGMFFISLVLTMQVVILPFEMSEKVLQYEYVVNTSLFFFYISDFFLLGKNQKQGPTNFVKALQILK